MTLIEIELKPAASARALILAGWDALEILKSALRGLFDTAQFLAALAIFVVVFIPIWGPILAVIFWVKRRRRKT